MSDLALYDVPQPGEWAALGKCRTPGATALFFPTRGEDETPAIAICGGCAVTAECLAYALPHSQLQGIWGGTSAEGRRRLRAQPPARPEPPVEPGPAFSPRGTLLRTLEELSAHPGRWCRIARYAATHSAGAMASQLRAGDRPTPPGSWLFEARRCDEGGSDLWAFLVEPESEERSA